MDTRVLMSLLFSGVCLSSAGLNKYILFEVAKTWHDAQEYCRSLHGDLATVKNMDDLNQLTVMTAGQVTWIGLNDFHRTSMDLYPNSWRWSTQTRSQTAYMNFASGQPNNAPGKKICVMFGTLGTWYDNNCAVRWEFFCFSGSSDAKTYHHITQLETWESAKSYCRTHYTDLAMIENEEENQQVLSAISSPVWIGLYRVPWTWSDGTNCSFRHWWSDEPDNRGGSQLCGVVLEGGFSDSTCNGQFPFICSGRKQTRIKIKIQSNLDLTNQNTKDNILLQLSASLASAGNTDFNLSWSAPPQKLEPAVKPSMDTRVLMSLLFSGVCFSSAGLNKYTLVEVAKTWHDAQEYCRSLHGDLATVKNMDDLNQLTNMTAGGRTWIGLNDFNRTSMDLYPNSWRWSTQTRSQTGYMNFRPGQPDYYLGKEECVLMETNGTWNDQQCVTAFNFICFSGSSDAKTYHYINQALSWESAKSYCRTHYTDLAMIENEEENQQVFSTVTNTYVWIGLYRVPWKWSDGTNCSFRHWYGSEPDNSARKQTRIKIKIQSDLDLTNQTIMDNILLQLSASLASAGNTDFNLSWSAPPQKLEPAGDDDNE
ncbi:Macrophage mannose receptor 1 [Merluccius polli]|uniref:Macrophage mannose receptor 1 n=1 Tax=Merluccius polli TaxID=89951 RepID=A0AA47N0Q5_MERPO|nr:Macrophage mannose receptor 1 [Merluccius polli]